MGSALVDEAVSDLTKEAAWYGVERRALMQFQNGLGSAIALLQHFLSNPAKRGLPDQCADAIRRVRGWLRDIGNAERRGVNRFHDKLLNDLQKIEKETGPIYKRKIETHRENLQRWVDVGKTMFSRAPGSMINKLGTNLDDAEKKLKASEYMGAMGDLHTAYDYVRKMDNAILGALAAETMVRRGVDELRAA